jgi:YD repeat-containing protein
MTASSGFSWTRAFEPNRNLITSVHNRHGTNLISSFDYTNDVLARRTQRVDNNTVTNDFGYNVRSKVIGAVMGTNSYSYAFDPIVNRLTATNNARVLTYQTNSLNQYTNILEGAAPSAPFFDLDGNMTAMGDGWRYVWNGENRLIITSNDAPVVTYAYDHQGRMVWKQVTTNAVVLSTRTLLWDGYNIIRVLTHSPTQFN